MGLDAAQLAKIRSDGGSTRLYLALLEPSTIFSAQINQTFSTDDMVAEITYDGGVGTYGDILEGMTLYIGTSAGDNDVGIARIRKAATDTIIYIGVESEIDFEDDLYLTVLDEFGVFARHAGIDSDGNVEMDWDTAYSDQHEDFDPVPVLGSHAVAWLTGSSVSVDFDGSNSWVIDSTISSYAWEISPSTGVTVTDDTTSTPNFSITTAGTYRVRCTVTAANGKTFTGTRFIFVFSDSELPVSDFELENCVGDAEMGGWSYQIRLDDESKLTSLRDRQLAILFARDIYEGVEGSVGLLDGRENIVAQGWIGGESIREDPEHDSRVFTVYGLQWWLGQIGAYPITLSMVAGTPSTWTEMAELSVDRALWHFLHWHTTVTAIADFYRTEDTRYAKMLDAQGESLWQQLLSLSQDRILARPIVDRYGRLFVDVPHNLRPLADRTDSVEVMVLESQDHEKTLDIPKTSPRAGQVNLASVSVTSTGTASTVYSLSPGHIPNYQGRVELLDQILAATQADANSLAGLILGERMNPFQEVPIELSRNNRAFGLAPRQYATVSLDAYSGKLLPKRIEYKFDPRSGVLTPMIVFEGETFEQLSVDGDIPDGDGGFLDIPSMPPIPPVPPLPSPILDPSDNAPEIVVVLVPGKGFWYTDEFRETSPRWFSWNWGLDSSRVATNDYWYIDVSHISGRGFIQTSGENPEVWTSPSPGEKWVLLAGEDFFNDYRYAAFGSYTTPANGALAVNRMADDSLVFALGNHYGSSYYPTQIFIGSSSGLTKTLEISTDKYKLKGRGMGVYGAGKWLLGWSDYSKFLSLFNLSATTREAQTDLSGGDTSVKGIRVVRGGLSGEIAAMWGGDPLQITDDNGATMTVIPTTDFEPYNPTTNTYLSVAIDPTGAYLAGFNSDATVNLRISSDGGVTWSLPGGWSGTGTSIENCGDRERWVMQALNGIYYTGDYFATWEDKTGDLRDKTSNPTGFTAMMIRVVR